MPSLNWNQIRREIQQYADLEKLKKELARLKAEIRSLNVRAFLSPTATKRLNELEAKYADVVQAIHRAQRQLDREVNKFMRKFKSTRQDAEKKIESLFEFAMAQKVRIEKASQDFKSKVMAKKSKASPKKKKSTRKKTTKKN